jgi:hypothetical protein
LEAALLLFGLLSLGSRFKGVSKRSKLQHKRKKRQLQSLEQATKSTNKKVNQTTFFEFPFRGINLMFA